MIPADAVAEVSGKAVMEAVIALAEREQCDQPVVARGDFGVVERLTERMRE